jgi:Ca2+-transporting ATPase
MLEAIRRGRTIHGNIRRSIRFILATNLSEIMVVLAATAGGLGQSLQPLQLLWINLISDVFPCLALAAC